MPAMPALTIAPDPTPGSGLSLNCGGEAPIMKRECGIHSQYLQQRAQRT